MIIYKTRGRHYFLKTFQLRGSVFPFSVRMALPSAIITTILKWAIDQGYNMNWMGLGENSQVQMLKDNAAWSGFTFLVGFLVVFRTSQAYNRFWDGCTYTHKMRAEWFDACSAIVAFCKHSEVDFNVIWRFQNTLVRLFSMLHAAALAEVEDCNTENWMDIRAFKFELIDVGGINKESLLEVQRSDAKVELIYQWIQQLVVEQLRTGILVIPPPILSRVFQEIANGMVAFHEAVKISSIPFPFPYAQNCDFLLMVHWLIVPIVTAQWVTTPWWGGIIAGMQVLTLWSLNSIALELENPFGSDANDMDMEQMQQEMNQFLKLLLSPQARRTPFLSDTAVLADADTWGQAIHGKRDSFVDIWASLSDPQRPSRSIQPDAGRVISELPVSSTAQMSTGTSRHTGSAVATSRAPSKQASVPSTPTISVVRSIRMKPTDSLQMMRSTLGCFGFGKKHRGGERPGLPVGPSRPVLLHMSTVTSTVGQPSPYYRRMSQSMDSGQFEVIGSVGQELPQDDSKGVRSNSSPMSRGSPDPKVATAALRNASTPIEEETPRGRSDAALPQRPRVLRIRADDRLLESRFPNEGRYTVTAMPRDGHAHLQDAPDLLILEAEHETNSDPPPPAGGRQEERIRELI